MALEVMVVGEFEREVWIPSTHPAARRGAIGLEELADLKVIYGPRRLEPVTYDARTIVVQTVNPRSEFTDLPRPLQQLLFDTADGLTEPTPARLAELVS